jgi:virginiamycin A acetyltransferase
MVKKLLFRIYAYDNQKTRQIIIRTVLGIEGGELYSETIRKIFSHYHKIEVGLYTYGGCFSSNNIATGTRIGRYSSFARDTYILGGNHPLNSISMHPFFYNPIFGYVDELLIKRKSPIIGNDVWVGQNAIILPSVNEIGNGAVIGAGSVVTKDVPPYAVFAGNPARLIRYRFTKQIIEKIVESRWWEKEINELLKENNEYNRYTKRKESFSSTAINL